MPLSAKDFERPYNPDYLIKTIISLARDTSEGARERLKKHLRHPEVCIGVSSKGGETAISILARNKNIRAVNALLTEGASIDWAVRGYARGGHVVQVNELIAK